MEQIFLTILNRGLTASLLVLVVILVRFVFQRTPKRFRCVLWALVAFRLLCPFSIESAFSLMPEVDVAQQVEERWGDMAETSGPDSVYAPGDMSGTTGNIGAVGDSAAGTVNVGEAGSQTDASSSSNAEKPVISMTQQSIPEHTWQQAAQAAVPYIWLAGIAAMGIYGVISYLKVKNQVKVSLHVKENIYYCDTIETPFVFGMFRAKIYLPSGLDEATAEYVIRHEQEHLRCKDMWWKLLGFLLLAVYWFHPMLWAAYILFCKDIEYACDERAIQGMDDENRKQYVTALLNCSIGKKAVLFCPTAFGETSVKGRIKSVLSYKKATVPIFVCAIVLVVAVVAVFLTDPKGEQQSTNLPEATPTERPSPTPTLAPGQGALPTTMIDGELYFMNGMYSTVKQSEISRIKELIEQAEYLGTTIHISDRISDGGYPINELESNCFVEGSKVYRYVEGEKVNFIIIPPNELTYNYVSGWHKYRWFEGKLIDAGEQDYNKTGMPTPTPTPTLQITVTYKPITVDGITRVLCSEGEGIELDLNGDGVAEQIYTAEEGIYINGVFQSLRYKWEPIYKPFETNYHQQWEEYYVVDLDTSDGYYNLVFFHSYGDDTESIIYYDGELKEIYSLSTLGSQRPFSAAEYHGDRSLVIKDVIVDFLGIQYGADLEYRLNEEGTLEQIETFIATGVEYELELMEVITMYSEPDYSSEKISVEPQTVYGLGTWRDWAKLRLRNGTEVWLHFKDVSGEGSILDNGKNAYDVFDGYPNAG